MFVQSFARLAWGETWSIRYESMLEEEDEAGVQMFREAVEKVWKLSLLSQPLDSMLRHISTNAATISLRQSLMRMLAIADELRADLVLQMSVAGASVKKLQNFLFLSKTSHDLISAAITDVKSGAVSMVCEMLPTALANVGWDRALVCLR